MFTAKQLAKALALCYGQIKYFNEKVDLKVSSYYFDHCT